MAALAPDVQTYIVMQLARHRTPSQVVRGVQDEFDVTTTRQQVAGYDPSKPWTQVGRALTELFKKERAAYYKTRRRDIPASAKDFRIAELQELYYEAKAKGRIKDAAALLEQIAKEEGGAYRKEAGGKTAGAPPGPAETVEEHARRVRDAVFQMDSATAADA